MKCDNCFGLGQWCLGPWDEEQATVCCICGGTGEVVDDSLDLSIPMDVIDERLRAVGADPEAIASRGVAFVARLRSNIKGPTS
jgi:hypothetical protein